ncbi:ISAs1 family transposase [bacterium]|nr:ISAs1 family transposase [bacterium]
MKPRAKPVLSATEQALLDGVSLRLIDRAERARCDRLLVTHHYLHRADLVGEQLRYVAESAGQWVALLTWNAAAFNLKDRETWIGWTPQQKRRRLSLVVNNSRFVILLPAGQAPNLASRVLKLCGQRLARDWQQVYGHAVLVAESFVDSQLFRGTCYKASGWTLLGQTQGYGRSRQDYYVAHERPKQLWVRELAPGGRTILRGRNLPAALAGVEAGQPPACTATPAELAPLLRFFGNLPDWRRYHGRYRVASLVALVVTAALCGVHRGQRDLAAFAANLTAAQCAALGLPRRGRRGQRRWLIPKETTFFRLLRHLDSRALEQALLAWQQHVLGARVPEDDQVAVDGKELLHSQGVQIASAYAVNSGRWLGSERVAAKSNEIPAVQELLRRAPIEGALVTADALHTQAQTARIITQERGGDYLLTVKANQPGVADSVRQLHDGLTRAFSPSANDGPGPAVRTQSQPSRSTLPPPL